MAVPPLGFVSDTMIRKTFARNPDNLVPVDANTDGVLIGKLYGVVKYVSLFQDFGNVLRNRIVHLFLLSTTI
jgi:hypothetical protein